MTAAPEVDVLIVGLGSTGVTLAALLADLGVSVVGIDRAPDIHPLPRAVHFDDEIMQVFERLRVTNTILEHATPSAPYEFRAADGQVLLRFNTNAAATPSGWRASYMFHQPGLERVLRTAAARRPNLSLRPAVELIDFTSGPDGVEAIVAAGDRRETLRARHLIGCDGASSAVRERAGIELFDYGFDEPWLVVDAVVNDPEKLPKLNLQICDPARPTTCIRVDGRRHRWEFMLLPGETPEEAATDTFVEALLAPWDVQGAIRIERRAVYRFHGLLAREWRRGRVLLAGDAAHQTPPFAGQGMCAGIRDAANLAWKLAAVVHGQADAALLDTYQTEREPNARAYIEIAIGMGRVVCLLDRDQAAARDARMLAQRASGPQALELPRPPPLDGIVLRESPEAGRRFTTPRAGPDQKSLEDLLGSRGWLIGNRVPKVDGPLLVSVDLESAALAPFRTTLEHWLSSRGVEAVLVRPDRYVFGTGDAEALLRAFRDQLNAQRVVEQREMA